jgi:serine/threonine protein phosphatase 1
MRTLAIGDIHGHWEVLKTLLAFVQVQPTDQLITLGDYVDRGPASAAVLDWVVAQQRTGQLIALRGNHEVMMSNARDHAASYSNWLFAGGVAALDSYGEQAQLRDVPAEHWTLLDDGLLPYYETDTHLFAHANIYPEYNMCDQPRYMLYWDRLQHPRPHHSGKVFVCGHTPQCEGRPRSWGHTVCIDTAMGWDGWLTCLDVDTGRYWQANEALDTRMDWL